MAIVPTVGRKVYYYEDSSQLEPIDGTIVRVFEPESAHPDSLVNVYIVEPGGNTRLIPQIQCQPEGFNGPHYRWMPYQLAQVQEAKAPPPTPAPAK